MKAILLLVVLAVAFVLVKRLLAGPSISASEAASRVAAGTSVLVDVREPGEWAGGVAGPAILCSFSDLRGARKQWRPLLEASRGKELILYCASGARSGVAADTLRREGFNAINAGSFGAWRGAGLAVRQP